MQALLKTVFPFTLKQESLRLMKDKTKEATKTLTLSFRLTELTICMKNSQINL